MTVSRTSGTAGFLARVVLRDGTLASRRCV